MPTRSAHLKSFERLDAYIAEQRAKRASFWSRHNGGSNFDQLPRPCHLPAFNAEPLPNRNAASARPSRIPTRSLQCASLPPPDQCSPLHDAHGQHHSLPWNKKGRLCFASARNIEQSMARHHKDDRLGNVAHEAVGLAGVRWPRESATRHQTISTGLTANRCDGGYSLSTWALGFELQALKAIKGRIEALDRLELVCERVQQATDDQHDFIAGKDPLMKLFFGTVAKLRTKTLDAVECAAAWERNVGSGRAFIHLCDPSCATVCDE
jgi:hypothetical protein